MFAAELGNWIAVKDGNDSARAIFDRHYSRHHYKDGRKPKLFCGPGQKLVLVTANFDALFIWRKFISDNWQSGLNCAVFRNEGALLSSRLILEAEQIARLRWPAEQRFYTYVAATKIRSTNPGYCFKRAGWKSAGITKENRLLVLEKVI